MMEIAFIFTNPSRRICTMPHLSTLLHGVVMVERKCLDHRQIETYHGFSTDHPEEYLTLQIIAKHN
jgi:hypothetical protein